MKLFVFICSCWFVIGSGQNCETWVSIPEEDYNLTYVVINSPQANEIRPLGFKKTTLRFGETPPCVDVSPTGGNDRHIEVKWELGLTGTLCLTNNVNNVEECTTGQRQRICSAVPGARNSVTYTFRCSGQNCESGDRQFWYRFLVEEPNEEGGYDENWCSTGDSRYPSTLATLSAITITPPTTTTKPGSATISSASWKLLLFSGAAAVLALFL